MNEGLITLIILIASNVAYHFFGIWGTVAVIGGFAALVGLMWLYAFYLQKQKAPQENTGS